MKHRQTPPNTAEQMQELGPDPSSTQDIQALLDSGYDVMQSPAEHARRTGREEGQGPGERGGGEQSVGEGDIYAFLNSVRQDLFSLGRGRGCSGETGSSDASDGEEACGQDEGEALSVCMIEHLLDVVEQHKRNFEQGSSRWEMVVKSSSHPLSK
jgi:hypothetical protein